MSTTILTGGPIRTMTEGSAGDAQVPEAVLVHDGVIQAVGSLTEMRRSAYVTPEEIDLDGRTLMPGFVDAHAHTILHGSAIDWVDLSGARSIDDVVRLLGDRAEARRGEAVRGYGYDQSKLAEGRHPSAADLDRVARDRVVQIQHASGHGYVVNTLALRNAGITAATSTPAGGRIDRDADGEPTGVLFDSACDLLTGAEGVKVRNHGPNFHLPMTHAEIDHLFDLGQRSLLEAGITTMCDAQVTQLEMDAYLRARDEGRLRMRTEMLALSSNLEHLTGLGMSSRLGDEQLRLWGVKLYADGSVIARTAYLNGHACCGKPSPNGYLYHEPEELAALITTAHRLGLSTATHAQGPLPIGVVLDAVAAARAERPRTGLVHRIEHCGFPTGEQIGRMADLHVVPVPQPMQVSLYGDSLMAEFGDFGGRFYPYGEFERAGLPVVISSDAPVTMPNPLEAVWAAVTRETLGGAISGEEGQRASRASALRGVTVTPAQMLGRQDIGVIRPGARADLTFLDADPVTVPVGQLPKVGVTESWIGGERIAPIQVA